ncbi:Uncharacterized protein DBV15_09666, partial [Temnothorax longispinosus]
IVGADSRAIRYAHLNHWRTEGHKFSRKSGRRGGGDGGDARAANAAGCLQLVHSLCSHVPRRTAHRVAFSPRTLRTLRRLVIVCTDFGILCGTVSGAFSSCRLVAQPALSRPR